MADNQDKPVEAGDPKPQAPEAPPRKTAPGRGKPGAGKGKQDQKKPPSKLGRFMRRLLWGIFLALALFAAGMAVSYVFVQQPKVGELDSSVDQLQSENLLMHDQVLQLQTELDDLMPLEDENRLLVIQLSDARLHVQILSALKDVQAAQIAAADADYAAARLALTRSPDKLEALREMLPLDNQGVVDGMVQRLELALDGLGSDAVAAASDLAVLANSLVQLENTLFSEP